MISYYQHSGKFSLVGILIGLVVNLAAGLLLAAIYAYVILYIPLAGWITFLLTGGYAYLLGLTASYVLKGFKVRNTGVAIAFTVVVALFSFYAHWVVWVFAFLQRADAGVNFLTIILQPAALWDFIVQVNGTGAWSLRDWTPTGAFLWAFWILEAIIILGLSPTLMHSAIEEDPFCEVCSTWCVKMKDILRFVGGNLNELQRKIEMKDFGYLAKRARAGEDSAAYYRIDLHDCPSCHTTHTLTMHAVTVSVDKNNKRSENEQRLINKLLLSSDENRQFLNLSKKGA